ncbi:response regulator transcription factor [Silvibacterium dinghuense]|uniref:Response regulator transcription factor n=1 Tax=Silvibacterium dinghuense TaxID=1560006 RepID=A0A4Q1S758_9BACT|nr:response regulator transcription factor [Silvibacterium dinghuense]
MSSPERIVYIVDDDARVRRSLANLLASFDIPTRAFPSALEYLNCELPDLLSCLILDINLPGLSGLALQQRLVSQQHPPIIFLTGHGDVPSSVQAMKAGAVDFLPKPFHKDQLLRAIDEAFQRHAESRVIHAELADLNARYGRLTPREREVLALIVAGRLNKQAAAELGISEITCQVHRGQIMRKMSAESLADLVRMASKLQIPLPKRLGSS